MIGSLPSCDRTGGPLGPILAFSAEFGWNVWILLLGRC
ncbi:hypothetical protein I546_3033 [Mycobacterium kansasii 732]|nr:hypothetical protein I546_3033 [Mycobacterium kansasii 732]